MGFISSDKGISKHEQALCGDKFLDDIMRHKILFIVMI